MSVFHNVRPTFHKKCHPLWLCIYSESTHFRFVSWRAQEDMRLQFVTPPHWLQWRMPKIAIRLVYKKHQREWGALWMVWRLHVLRSASTKGQVDCCLRSTGWRVLLYFFLTDYTISALQVLRIKPYNSTALWNRLVVETKAGIKGTFSSVADSL